MLSILADYCSSSPQLCILTSSVCVCGRLGGWGAVASAPALPDLSRQSWGGGGDGGASPTLPVVAGVEVGSRGPAGPDPSQHNWEGLVWWGLPPHSPIPAGQHSPYPSPGPTPADGFWQWQGEGRNGGPCHTVPTAVLPQVLGVQVLMGMGDIPSSLSPLTMLTDGCWWGRWGLGRGGTLASQAGQQGGEASTMCPYHLCWLEYGREWGQGRVFPCPPPLTASS